MFRATRWRVEKNKIKLVFKLKFRATQGLQDVIKVVPIDLGNRPAWYKEKVYPPNKVPSLEHNNEIKGESLDLIKYIDSHFKGPSLLPEDPAPKKFTEEMFSYTDKFSGIMRYAFSSEGDVANEIDGPLDHLGNAFSKFDDGPFFLDVAKASAPSIECLEAAVAAEGAAEIEILELEDAQAKARRKLKAAKAQHQALREQKIAIKDMGIEVAPQELEIPPKGPSLSVTTLILCGQKTISRHLKMGRCGISTWTRIQLAIQGSSPGFRAGHAAVNVGTKVQNELPEKIERLVRCEASVYQKLLMKRVEDNLGSLGFSVVD